MSPSAMTDSRYSEEMLVDLLHALRARASSHPENPGLIAFWPAVPEHLMAGACNELVRLGYPVKRVSIDGWNGAKTRNGWALGA